MTTAKELLALEEWQEQEELEGKREFLATDPIAAYRVWVGNKHVGLDYFIGKKEGELKHSFTIKEARALAMRPDWYPHTRTKDNRIPREVVLDELADHFNISEQELIDRIEEIAQLKPKIAKGITPKAPVLAEPEPTNALLVLFVIGILFVGRRRRINALKY